MAQGRLAVGALGLAAFNGPQLGHVVINFLWTIRLVEAFFNESRSISIRAYTEDPSSQGISLNGTGDIVIEELYVAAMGSIFK